MRQVERAVSRSRPADAGKAEPSGGVSRGQAAASSGRAGPVRRCGAAYNGRLVLPPVNSAARWRRRGRRRSVALQLRTRGKRAARGGHAGGRLFLLGHHRRGRRRGAELGLVLEPPRVPALRGEQSPDRALLQPVRRAAALTPALRFDPVQLLTGIRRQDTQLGRLRKPPELPCREIGEPNTKECIGRAAGAAEREFVGSCRQSRRGPFLAFRRTARHAAGLSFCNCGCIAA